MHPAWHFAPLACLLLFIAGLIYIIWGKVKRPMARRRMIRAATDAANGLLAKRDEWVVVDTETTGIKDTDVAIQIAVVDGHGDVLINTLTQLPKGKKISARAQQTHGITADTLIDAPTWAAIRAQLDQAINGRTCLAYNASFDQRIIDQTDRAHNVTGGALAWLDVMPIYNSWAAEWDARRRKIKWQKLPGGDHTAIGDCVAVIDLLEKIANNRRSATAHQTR